MTGMNITEGEELQLPQNPFTRLTYSQEGKAQSFDTSLVTFVSNDGSLRVTLIAAIHIGEKDYYQTLNEKFTQYETVLFEMVGDDDPRPQSAEGSSGIITAMQLFGAELLDLEFQIGSIDYQAQNFVHADMTAREFREAMQKRGDGLLVWFVRSYAYGQAMPSGNSLDSLRLLEVMVARNRKSVLRQIWVESVANIDSTSIAIEGKNGSSIIRDRNTKALQVLQEQIKSGKKNIAIFYGAAHLPDFAERLQKEFGMKPEKIEWIQCWKLD